MGATVLLLLGALLAWCLRFAIKFHAHRRQYAKLPGPPHSYWFGHLQVVDKMIKELPPNAHIQVVMTYMGQKYGLKDAWYIDMWPAAAPFMVIANADIAQQLTVTNSMPKHRSNKEFLRDLTGDKAVVTLEGPEWKEVRSVLMPSYSPSHVLTLVPMMLREISIMCDRLLPLADQNSLFRIQEYFTDMTIDVIGYATIGIGLNAQSTGSPIAHSFKRSVKLSAEGLGAPISRYRNGMQFWWHTRQITNEVKKVISARWQETRSEKPVSKTAVDLLLGAVRDGNQTFSPNGDKTLDGPALSISTDQVKTLLLGGHDTSSAIMCYAICLLSQDPKVLSRIREEHSKIIPPSASRDEAIAILTNNPSRINDLPYTTAVLKEVFRLFPTSSTARAWNPNSPLKTIKTPSNPDQELPLDVGDQNIFISSYIVHHNPDHFSDSYKFIPDRFIPSSEYARTHPFPAHAWRPFEKGPRACIGMELAMVEIRLVLVMFLREFDVEVAYAKDAPRLPESLGGMQWYQILEFAAKPVDGLPVKLKRRTQ